MTWPAKTILCATDLSPTGDGAVALAHALAGKGSTVHLLFVDEPAYLMSPLDATVLYAPAGQEKRRRRVEDRVRRHLRGLVPRGGRARGVRTEILVLHEAGPAGVILREARRLRADAVVLGTRGRRALAKALLGSVADAVARRAPIPVLLLRSALKPAAPQRLAKLRT
jgi:nucleotide-binding universal stress UspA family protein